MTIDYKQDEIKEKELKTGIPFAGYFSPQGELIDFNDKISGETHNNTANPVALTYLKYISYIITNEIKNGKYGEFLKDHNPEKLREMSLDGIDELIYRGYGSYYTGIHLRFEDFYKEIIEDLNACENRIKNKEEQSYDRFKLDLLRLFVNAYKNASYIKSIGKITRVDNQSTIEEKLKKEYSLDEDDTHLLLVLLEKTVSKELLSGFKDICVQYLGYDSIERFDLKGNKIVIPKKDEDYDSMFYSSPRVITSSYKDVYDRYYNYLLMDWSIYQVPRYKYNEETGIYEKEEEIINPYREEQDLKKMEEIQSIKKLVPIRERIKFFK